MCPPLHGPSPLSFERWQSCTWGPLSLFSYIRRILLLIWDNYFVRSFYYFTLLFSFWEPFCNFQLLWSIKKILWGRLGVLLIVDSVLLFSIAIICHWRPKKQTVLLGEIYCIFVVDFMSFSSLYLKKSCISRLNSMIFQVIIRNSPLLFVWNKNLSSCRLSRVESGILWLDA